MLGSWFILYITVYGLVTIKAYITHHFPLKKAISHQGQNISDIGKKLDNASHAHDAVPLQ